MSVYKYIYKYIVLGYRTERLTDLYRLNLVKLAYGERFWVHADIHYSL